jgi:hypothetical protein
MLAKQKCRGLNSDSYMHQNMLILVPTKYQSYPSYSLDLPGTRWLQPIWISSPRITPCEKKDINNRAHTKFLIRYYLPGRWTHVFHLNFVLIVHPQCDMFLLYKLNLSSPTSSQPFPFPSCLYLTLTCPAICKILNVCLPCARQSWTGTQWFLIDHPSISILDTKGTTEEIAEVIGNYPCTSFLPLETIENLWEKQ